MYWITNICKTSQRTNHKRICGWSRCEVGKHFHRKNCTADQKTTSTSQSQPQLHQASRNTAGGENNLQGGVSQILGRNNKDKDDGDSIVITGISGRFPISDSMAEFKHNLFNKIEMVTPMGRWTTANPLMPKRMGAMKNMDKFDAGFFGIKPMHADTMDPQQRRLLEVSFEAIFDAGINPTDMRGTPTGVFVGTVGGETSEFWLFKGDYDESGGYRILGIPNFLQPNRVSYCLDFCGPSMGVNTGCSASLQALECAIQGINEGTCDQAIVAGTTIHVNPFGFIELAALEALSHEGICRAFDDAADGFVRSEAVIAILVQKKRHAKRHYATVRAIKSGHDAYKREGITFPSGKKQEELLRATYAKAGIDPGAVTYFEAHGTGTPAGDPQELIAISKVMCKAESRTEPLLIGSVKSNMGHAESAAGLGSLAKVLIAIEQGSIPPNINFETPNEYVKDLFDGSFVIVTEPTPWKGGLVGISSFGIGGSTLHMVLEPGPKINPANEESQKLREEKQVPILIPFSGRTKETVEASLKEAVEVGKNFEATGLIHEIFQRNIPGHPYRGYGIMMPGEDTKDVSFHIDKYDEGEKRPLWFVFPGMGSQWNEMGKDLMKLDAFAESINKSQATSKNAGLDLLHLLRPNNPSIFDNIRDSLVAITAVQIALYDTLTSMGLKPDGYIGHSSGEILCAYADNCLSREEALLVGDARGRAFHETVTAPGGMASVGLSWEKAIAQCPPGVYAACHNAAENVTVSGPLDDIKAFVEKLQSEGVFARQVNSCNCAPHTKYILPAYDVLKKYMYEIYTDGETRFRSEKWLSSSIPEADWDTPLAKTSTPEYHTNNMTSQVLFHEVVQKIPANSVVVEIAPRGLFQALLRESVPMDCTLVAPMHHSVEDKVHFFLSSVGKLYNAGVDLKIGSLYPPLHFPVSSSTPMLSSMLKWNHEQSWAQPYLSNPTKILGASFKVDIEERKHSYLHGHKLDSRCVYPGTGYLSIAWRSFAASNDSWHEDFPIVLEDVSFERATFLKEGKSVEFKYTFLSGVDKFIIEQDGVVVIKGTAKSMENVSQKMFDLPPVQIPEEPLGNSLNADDVYKEFRLRGYNYTREFRGIQQIDNEGKWAKVAWNGNWVSFLDTMLQTSVLSVMTRATAVPVRFKSVIIDPVIFLDYVKTLQEAAAAAASEQQGPSSKEVLIPVSVYPELGTIKCPGVEMRGLTAMIIPRQKQKETLSVEDYNFTPYFDSSVSLNNAASGSNTHPSPISVSSHVAGLIDLVIENTTNNKLKILDIFASADNSLTDTIANIIDLKPKHKADVTMLTTASELEKIDEKIQQLATTVTTKETVESLIPDPGFIDLVFLDQPSILQAVSDALPDNAYLVLRSPSVSELEAYLVKETQIPIQTVFPASLQRVSEKMSESSTLTLFKKLPAGALQDLKITAVCVDNKTSDYDWLPNLQSVMADAASDQSASKSNSRIYLYSQNDPHSGIVGMAKCLRLEPGGEKIRCIYDPEGKLTLDFENPAGDLKNIIETDLVMNVIKNGALGSYRHIPMSQDAAAASKQVHHAYVNTITTGDLTSLRWVESPLTYHDPIRNKDAGEVCTVHYAALNFRDIMLATGKLPVDSKTSYNPQDCVFGFEFSGVDSKNERIMGVMGSKAMASSVLIGPDSIKWKIPDSWSLEEAATIPVVYSTAYYALYNRARILPGQSILIHSGTGGVGQAAINIALDLNCEIFTTVGTPEKRKHIKELFPSLKDENIGNSRDCSFEEQVMRLTKGRGVDIVLNSLADDKLQASIRCVAVHGKFLEIGAFDSFQNSNLGMECFLRNVDLQGIFLNHFLSGSMAEKETLQKHFLDGIQRGVVKPLARTVFKKEEIEEAFRFMAGGKHMGKVLIEVLNESKETIGTKPSLMAVPRSYFSPSKIYIIIGGLGGMGLELANWLVDRGARNLILTSRSGVTTGYQQLCLRKWQDRGVNVTTPIVDFGHGTLADQYIEDLTKNGGQIGGIFNSGLVLEDGPIEEQTVENFEAVSAPKLTTTKNLDAATRKFCTGENQKLDYFVVFSSMACGRGNGSQSNYGLANSAMEQICEKRREDGHHGLAIQWGVIGEVGALAEKIFGAKLTGDEVFEGTLAQRIASCLDVLDMTLHQTAATVSSMVLAEDGGMKSSRAGLLATISHICGVKDISTIDPATKLIDLGMDSLIGIEIKQLIERDYDTPLTANEIRSMTFNDLMMIEAGTYVKGQALNASMSQDDAGSSEMVSLMDLLKGPTEVLVRLKSAAGSSTGSGSGTAGPTSKLFVLPGIEGNSILLQHLAEQLESQVYGFHFITQPGEAQGQEIQTVESIAREYIEELKFVQPEGPYNITSYSACTSIAYEMAVTLENEYGDKVENLIVLDGTVCWRDSEADANTVAQAIIGIFKSTLDFSSAEEKKIEEALLESHETYMLAEVLKLKYPKIDASLVGVFVERGTILFNILAKYQPAADTKLKAKATLIKAQDKVHFMAGMEDDSHYLGRYCEAPVTVHTVDGDHVTFLLPEKVEQSATIINEIVQSSNVE